MQLWRFGQNAGVLRLRLRMTGKTDNDKSNGRSKSLSPSGMTSKKSDSKNNCDRNRRSFDSDAQRRASSLRMTLLFFDQGVVLCCVVSVSVGG
jgi:hypothetical protein